MAQLSTVRPCHRAIRAPASYRLARPSAQDQREHGGTSNAWVLVQRSGDWGADAIAFPPRRPPPPVHPGWRRSVCAVGTSEERGSPQRRRPSHAPTQRTPARAHLSTVRRGCLTIRAAAFSRITGRYRRAQGEQTTAQRSASQRVGPVVDLFPVAGPVAVGVPPVGIGAIDIPLIVVIEAIAVTVRSHLRGRVIEVRGVTELELRVALGRIVALEPGLTHPWGADRAVGLGSHEPTGGGRGLLH